MGKDLRNGSTMIAPMFINVGGVDSIKISDITVTGYTPYADYDHGTSGEVVIKVLDSSGATALDENEKKMEYFFYDNEDTDPNEGGPGVGWYRNMEVSEGNKVTEIPFDVGQGLWVSGKKNYKLQLSGQVALAQVVVPLRNGSVGTGNPYAVSRKISDFRVTDYTPYADYDHGTSGEVVIKVLDSSGATALDENEKKMEYFFYDNEDTDPNEGGPGVGWYRNMEVSEDNKVTEIPFDAGQGLWVSGKKGYNLKITPPTLD